MITKLGTSEDRKRDLDICRKANMTIKSTGDMDKVTDPLGLKGGELVVVILKLKEDHYIFRYNPEYWNGL